MDSDFDDSLLHVAIAARLAPLRPAGDLRLRLLDRIRQSALAHEEYRTVRVEDEPWHRDASGVSRRQLRADEHTRVDIWQLADGAMLPWPDEAKAQEILVLGGALASAESGSLTAGVQGRYAYHVRHRVEAGEPMQAVGATTLYVRQLLVDAQQLPALEAHWWRLPAPASGWIDPGRKRWHGTSEGVEVLPLRGDREVVSMLVRFAPGASVPDHRHALDEDCLVLEGEMFLGDILLRTGDYQLAPAGGSHFGEMSDVGVLFFFHGALDPVLRGEARA
jgi:anti-sigma factor ChrR (cupin superfamily)